MTGTALVPVPATPERGRGRPTSYTRELALEICERLAVGEYLFQICEGLTAAGAPMPGETTIKRWVLEDRREQPTDPDGFRSMYALARKMQTERELDQAAVIAKTPLHGVTTTTKEVVTKSGIVTLQEERTGDMIEARRLQVDFAKWKASKVLRHDYGEPKEQPLDSPLPGDPQIVITGGLPERGTQAKSTPPPPRDVAVDDEAAEDT